jgi:hypothetical protein
MIHCPPEFVAGVQTAALPSGHVILHVAHGAIALMEQLELQTMAATTVMSSDVVPVFVSLVAVPSFSDIILDSADIAGPA